MISFRTGNVVAILIAIFGFYCSLTGLTPQNLAIALTRRTRQAAEDTHKIVNNVISIEETESPQPLVPTQTEQWPTDTPPATNYSDSPRLIRHTGNSNGASRLSNEATSSPQ